MTGGGANLKLGGFLPPSMYTSHDPPGCEQWAAPPGGVRFIPESVWQNRPWPGELEPRHGGQQFVGDEGITQQGAE